MSQVRDHDVSEWDAAVGVCIDATVDSFNEVRARPRQLGSDDVEQVAGYDLSVAAAVEEGTQLFEVLVAQLRTEIDQSTFERLARDLSWRAAPAVHLHGRSTRQMNAHENTIS